MILLLDTHAWIWWAASSPNLSRKALKAIRSAGGLRVSAISCWEVAMLVAKGRLVLDRDVEVWMDLALKLPRVQLVPLSPRIAVRSSRLASETPGDPADRILIATALEVGCTLITKDDRIRRFTGIRSIW